MSTPAPAAASKEPVAASQPTTTVKSPKEERRLPSSKTLEKEPSSSKFTLSIRPSTLAKRFSSMRNSKGQQGETQSENVKEGFLFKKGGGPSYAWKRRFFLLTNNRLLYYFKSDPNTEKNGQAKPRGIIFKITNKHHIFFFFFLF